VARKEASGEKTRGKMYLTFDEEGKTWQGGGGKIFFLMEDHERKTKERFFGDRERLGRKKGLSGGFL